MEMGRGKGRKGGFFHIAISGHRTVGSVVLEVRETEDVKGWEHRVQVSAVGL